MSHATQTSTGMSSSSRGSPGGAPTAPDQASPGGFSHYAHPPWSIVSFPGLCCCYLLRWTEGPLRGRRPRKLVQVPGGGRMAAGDRPLPVLAPWSGDGTLEWRSRPHPVASLSLGRVLHPELYIQTSNLHGLFKQLYHVWKYCITDVGAQSWHSNVSEQEYESLFKSCFMFELTKQTLQCNSVCVQQISGAKHNLVKFWLIYYDTSSTDIELFLCPFPPNHFDSSFITNIACNQWRLLQCTKTTHPWGDN